ncbi:MAG: radical SAM protein [Acutalibacteraceae bacterium]
MKCRLCPRMCGVDRESQLGCCKMPWDIMLSRASKHFWEEPPISGTKGSGTVFFSGCNLGCVFCQNYEISHEGKGKTVSDERLIEIFYRLIGEGVHNINLVNPTHYAAAVRRVLLKAKLPVPVVYNSSGYERVETLKSLEGLIQIYLPDFKYITAERSLRYSDAENYFSFTSKALLEMKRQCPENAFDSEGILKKGLIVRHLVLPQNTNRSIEILKWIKENLGTDTFVSIMSQYTPYGKIENVPELQRKITKREYEKVVSAAEDLGFQNLYTQDFSSSSEKFIPEFDFRGI